ncbi:neuronal acetylcholine receptor subunit alpha-6-like [Haliotis rubra]|uniref:neuronal acetylcholine receptor subunit alpha-6-like n=1 Tax=Haliotis rubra TaxID=36100 RepID=UPI001EE50CD5|nr:neuronal acetylcholine receptor subunit alpha-6-like [Haliotis rubra]
MFELLRCCLLLLLCHLTLGSNSFKEKDFLANLTLNYDPKIRPVLDGSNTTEFMTLGVTQPWIEVTFVLKRRTTFYILNNILPVVFLSFLNTFVFCLPEESGEKMSLCVSILLSYAMFLTLINSYLPANSDHLCFFSVYLTLLVLISTLTCLVTIFMLALHTYFQTGKACPRWLPVAWRSDSKVGTSEPWVKKEDIVPNQSDVNGKANNKSEMKDLIIAKCNRVAFGTFFTDNPH